MDRCAECDKELSLHNNQIRLNANGKPIVVCFPCFFTPIPSNLRTQEEVIAARESRALQLIDKHGGMYANR